MRPAQLRKLIGKTIDCYNQRFNERWTMVIVGVNAKRRTVKSADGGVFDYTEFTVESTR